MNFRTELNIAPSERKISHKGKILAVGSCFAHNIAVRLRRAKFGVTVNPFGEMFNPLSLVSAFDDLHSCRRFTEADLNHGGGLAFCYRCHGSFDAASDTEALAGMNRAVEDGARALGECDTVIITLGTAWIYEHCGEAVANCHKQPSSEFVRRRLSVEEIVSVLGRLFEEILEDKHIILTVSPVRHLGDGLVENSLSKAILRVATAELAQRYPHVDYFPAYELLIDDLRDYRFYADDMAHPSDRAVDYIWQKFSECYMSAQTLLAVSKFENLAAAASHRPLHPDSTEYAKFRRSMASKVAALQKEFPETDLSAEAELFAE